MTDAAGPRDVHALMADAIGRLSGAPRERLGALEPERRILGIPRAARIRPAGDAWHLGVLLLTPDMALLETGEIVRARTEARRGYTAESQRQRAALAAAARRGGFAEGETVHVGWSVIDVDAVARGEASGPLALRDGVPMVRWSHSTGFVPLAGYLDERIELLRHPLPGA
ncbi:glutaminase [Microbacterium candidum]|uniref:Glutaminase n=1 Tax=Microbacterium candidum TaxID=3041922 RepID=A0ABT7MVM7_9MICO|nr:glutaminase [Microbacterium sp. ASV49]MDL9978507.1 glutaminase [Microbacterium sp. ASV49]